MTEDTTTIVDERLFTLKDLEVKERNILQEIRDIYDGYAHSYNNAGNIVTQRSYTANLLAIMEACRARARKLRKEIEDDLSAIGWELSTMNGTLWDYKLSKEASRPEPTIEVAVEQVTSSMQQILMVLSQGTDDVTGELDHLKASYGRFVGQLDDSPSYHPKHYLNVQRLLEKAVNHSRIQLHVQMLSELTDAILFNNYPDQVPVYENLSQSIQEALRQHGTGYGAHQVNQQWVRERFWELERTTSLSQNKRVQLIIEEYKRKFNLSISEYRILTFAGKYQY